MKSRKFNIFGEEYTYMEGDHIINENEEIESIQGLTDPSNRTVTVCRYSPSGYKYSNRDIEVTKLHELMHVILSSGQFLDEYKNEPLVEWLAKCIYSLKEQKMI